MNRIHVFDENLHENKQGKLVAYSVEIEMIGKVSVGDEIRQTLNRFRNITDYESYSNAIDEGYDAEDAIFKAYIYKINTPQFILVSRSQYGNGCDFKHQKY